MTSKTWPEERVVALYEYLDAHPEDFEPALRSKLGYPKAATFISQKLKLDPPFTASQISGKLNKLHKSHKSGNISLDEFLKLGSRGVCLPFLDGNSSRSTNSSPYDGDCALTRPAPNAPAAVVVLPIHPAVHSQDKQESSRTCNGCLERETTNKSLRAELTAMQKSYTFTSYGLAKLKRMGPQDKQIRHIMEDICKTIDLIVVLYREAGLSNTLDLNLATIDKNYPRLSALMKQAFCIDAGTDLFESIGRSLIMCPKSEELLQGLIGTATLHWALDSTFPEFLHEKSVFFRKYQLAVQERDGETAHINIQQSALKSLIDDPNFQRDILNATATDLAKTLTGIVAPLLAGGVESNITCFPGGNGLSASWSEQQRKMRMVFEKSLSLCANLRLNVGDYHSFFWPTANDDFDGKIMSPVQHKEKIRSQSRVIMTVFPGLLVHGSRELSVFEGVGDEEEEAEPSMKSTDRREGGDIISKAIVILST